MWQRKWSLEVYDRESLIKTLEDHGYVKSDIQRSNISGDMLQFAMLIQIAEKLDRDSPTLTPAEKKEVKNEV